MSADAPDKLSSPPSGRDRRAHFRVNVVLPICIQPEADTAEASFIQHSVNLSGGGIGVVVNRAYKPNDILSLSLLLPDHGLFQSYIEVLRMDPLPYHPGSYRLHAHFIRMATQNQELLIRYVMRFQRDHLQAHYSA